MSDALQDRYAAVERLYGQGQWEQVLETSAALLGDLPQQPGESLRIRLLLLQAHAHLHGLGQIDSAAALYHQVLDERPEPLLQAIAQRELGRCQESLPPPAAEPEPAVAPLGPSFPFVAQAVGTPGPGQAASAMPWLEAESRQGEPLDLEPIAQPQLEPEPTAPITALPRWSPAEEAELATGMLLVVLGSAGG